MSETRTLLIWPEPIENFTRSDAYQQVPRALLMRSKTTLLSASSGSPPDDMVDDFERWIAVSSGRKAFVRDAVAQGTEAHRHTPFDRIVSAFDVRSLVTASRLSKRLRVPWFAVCEDYPFGERYRDADRNQLLRIARSFHTFMTKRWLARAKRVVTFINPGVLDFLQLPEGKIAALSNAADLARLERFRKPLHEASANRLGYVGYVSLDKGAEELAYALAAVREKLPGMKMTLIGETIGAAEMKMRNICADGLEFLGDRNQGNAMRELAHCAVFLHAYQPRPWLYHNQVLKICEYMALGRPVVSVDTPGVRDLMSDGVEGFLVPHGATPEETGKAIAKNIVAIMRDARLLKKMSSAGIKRTEGELNWQKMAERFWNVVKG
ncbi:glycosyltransferase family 4 protein [bacterium]|nr:glycosyltransferase family 4 protein [bacterium]